MLENSFYWDFENRDDSVQKSDFISFIQRKNRETQSHHPQQQQQQRSSNHTSTNVHN